MPNRIIKESICTSPNLNELPIEAEVFFYRLLVNCDDYGRMDGRPAILRSRCYPLRLDEVKDSDVEAWLQCLVSNKLIITYAVDGQRYLQVSTWDRHQQIRAKRSKYPDPNGHLKTHGTFCEQVIADDSKCSHQQVIADDSKCPRNPIQSNPIQSESNHLEGSSPSKVTKNISSVTKTESVPLKQKLGEFLNVLLTTGEHEKLVTKFGETGTKGRIEGLSAYKKSKGVNYKDDYATIVNWSRRDKETSGSNQRNPRPVLKPGEYTPPGAD